MIGTSKATKEPSISFQIFQKCLKKIRHDEISIFPLISSQSTNVAIEKVLVPIIALLQWLRMEGKCC